MKRDLLPAYHEERLSMEAYHEERLSMEAYRKLVEMINDKTIPVAVGEDLPRIDKVDLLKKMRKVYNGKSKG